MQMDLPQLVEETIELTGADPPALLDPEAPVLTSAPAESLYLVGLVGGKDVGKSSLVNALVGQQITTPTSFGPGTDKAIAYVHKDATTELRHVLASEAFTVTTHTVDSLKNQVLLDLPDIDSHYADHVKLTRRMLRHMLYPLWIQSIEKYADRMPQQLLAAVAEGNDPANFIFCLNKADQLRPEQAEELRQDYAKRIARVLELPAPPRVYLLSAARPQEFDLPELRRLLSRSKPTKSVDQAWSLANRRRQRSLLGWIEHQRLSERAAHLTRIEQDAREITAAKIVLPLVDRAIPRLLDDPGQKMSLVEPATRARLSRWPIVNALDALLSPALSLAQKNAIASTTASTDPDVYLDRAGAVSTSIQTAFAQIQQLHPDLGAMYRDRKLWENMPADLAAADLRRNIDQSLRQQREKIVQGASGRFNLLLAPWRWLLTVGAIVWFPILQPISVALLQQDAWAFTKESLLVVVKTLSVAHFLSCATFLLIWFLGLWVVLRWLSQRRTTTLLRRWSQSDDESSLSGQVNAWADELLEPIHQRRERVDSLVQRVEQAQNQITASS